MESACPDCRQPLHVVDAGTGHTLVCSSCHGRMVGLSPFERMVGTGVGADIWRAAAAGTETGTCPYCQRALHRPNGPGCVPVDGAEGAGIAVCRLCREVWLPAAAMVWLSENGAPAPTTDPAVPDECVNCGASYQPDSEGKCPYCRTQIAAPQPLVMIFDPPAEPPSIFGGGWRLF